MDGRNRAIDNVFTEKLLSLKKSMRKCILMITRRFGKQKKESATILASTTRKGLCPIMSVVLGGLDKKAIVPPR